MTVEPPPAPLVFRNPAAWRDWLEVHHTKSESVWLAISKKGSTNPGLGYEEAVEAALCFGWIDGQVKALDAEAFLLRVSPRRPGSVWSESNKRRVERLLRDGRMTEAGLRKVAEAQSSGEWEAATLREDTGALPPVLEQALRRQQGALAGFHALAVSRQKQLIWWVSDAKREATRARRLQAVVDEALRRRPAPVSVPE